MNNNFQKDRKDRKKRLRLHCGIVLFGLTIMLGATLSHVPAKQSNESHEIKSDYKVKDKKAETAKNNEAKKKAETAEANAAVLSMWNHVLVNPWNKLPENFTVDLQQLGDGQAIDKRAYPDLQAMMDDARAQGLSPVICSSYRAPEKQEYLFDDKIKRCEEQLQPGWHCRAPVNIRPVLPSTLSPQTIRHWKKSRKILPNSNGSLIIPINTVLSCDIHPKRATSPVSVMSHGIIGMWDGRQQKSSMTVASVWRNIWTA